jgi:DNA-binding CsgD family transcriptional regulator/tetratricopeptide (TPR) repeat protein
MVVAIRDLRLYEFGFDSDPDSAPCCPTPGARPTGPRLDLIHPELRAELDSRRGPALYGRDAERSSLRAALAEAFAGRGRLVLVGGEAGIGKTALVQELAAKATQEDALVLTAGCDDLVSAPPYGPWVDLIRAYESAAGLSKTGLPPVPDGLASADVFGTLTGHDALFGQTVGFLAEVAAVRPVGLVLEDLHWADGASLDLLRFVARRLPGLALLIVATYRDAELDADAPLARALPQLARESAPLRLDLRRLDAEAVRRFVAERYPLAIVDESRLVTHLRRFAEGNPFYVEEVLRALEQDGLLAPLPGAGPAAAWRLGELVGVQVPLVVRRVVAGRVDRLGSTSRRLLQLAAVIGSTVPLDLWAEIAAVAEDDLIEAVEAALATGLLVEAPDRSGLRFRHALIREALYEEVVLPRRRAWHRRIAEALAAGYPLGTQPDPDSVAHHFVQAGDARAAHWLIEAGHRAARRDAIRDAIDRYEAALDRCPDDPAMAVERGWLLWELAELNRSANTSRAFDYLDEADRLALGDQAPALAVCLRWTRLRLRGLRGEPVLDDMIAVVAAFEALPAAERANVATIASRPAPNRAAVTQWAALHGRYDLAIAEGLNRLAAAGAAPTVPSLADLCEIGDTHAGLGLAYAAVGRPALARGALERARRYAQSVGSPFMDAWVLRWALREAILPFAAQDLVTRRSLVEAYGAIFAGLDGFPVEGPSALPLFPVLLLEGDWAQAEEAAKDFLAVDSWRVHALLTLGELDRARGECAAAWARVHEALPDGPATDLTTFYFVGRLALVRLAAALALDAERPDEALPWLAAHDRWLETSGRTVDRAAGLLLWARHALADGDADRAAELAREALARAREPRQALAELAACRFLGELATAAGDHAAAERRLASALALAEACAAPYEQALTLLARAELHAARGAAAAAQADLDAARAILVSLGARPALARAEAIATVLAADVPVTASEPIALAPATSAEPAATEEVRRTIAGGISPRELEVLRLVARGLTDAEAAGRLFISPRTVARHLQSVYNKLGVNSRTAAAAFAFERGLV